MAHCNFQVKKQCRFFRLRIWMRIQGKTSAIKLLMLTKASTTKSMWATLNPNPHEFPIHTN